MNEQVTAITAMQQQYQQLITVRNAEQSLDVEGRYTHPGDINGKTRCIPVDFKLTAKNVIVGWRFWKLGNRSVGAGKSPVWPYEKITRDDLAGPQWRSTSQNLSKWRKVFTFLESGE